MSLYIDTLSLKIDESNDQELLISIWMHRKSGSLFLIDWHSQCRHEVSALNGWYSAWPNRTRYKRMSLSRLSTSNGHQKSLSSYDVMVRYFNSGPRVACPGIAPVSMTHSTTLNDGLLSFLGPCK